MNSRFSFLNFFILMFQLYFSWRVWSKMPCWKGVHLHKPKQNLTLSKQFYPAEELTLFSNFLNFKAYFTNYWANTRHVCTYFNAFLMVIPTTVTNFKICDILSLSSAHVCSALSSLSHGFLFRKYCSNAVILNPSFPLVLSRFLLTITTL